MTHTCTHTDTHKVQTVPAVPMRPANTHTSLCNSVKVIESFALCALSSLVTHLNGPDRKLPIHPEDQLPDRESTQQ